MGRNRRNTGNRRKSSKSGSRNSQLSLGSIILLIIIIGVVFWLTRNEGNVTPPPDPGLSQPGALTNTIGKPEPIAMDFQGCPPSGDGGDPVLNTLKNRVDETVWQPTTISAVLALDWPESIEGRSRARWSPADAQAVAQHEGTPVQLEGYLVQAKKMSPETCNCHSVEHVDYHIWMVDEPDKDRDQSIVIETSPRVRAHHPEWGLRNMSDLARRKEKVRISGWLMMDPEHPDQVGKTRGTIWEIHPVMQIETFSGGAWRPLDDGSTGVRALGEVAQTAPPVTPEAVATMPPVSDRSVQDNTTVRIVSVLADGKKTNEPDEYVEIKNTGTEPVDITDWVLQDNSAEDLYKWESYVMQPGASIRVYTNEVHQDTGGFSLGANRPVWANRGDIAELYDADKVLISRYAYGDKR
ncbi:MAG: lamin tail domain-containing protein [Chloroflexota bacterium]|nr:lamin tail domain-containing protein [Chloroflexota bacterium]